MFQQGQTPLHLAAENDYSDVVKMFLKYRPELVSMANTVSDDVTQAYVILDNIYLDAFDIYVYEALLRAGLVEKFS